MRCIPLLSSLAATEVPTISGRYFTSGSAMVKVSGSVQIDQEVAIKRRPALETGR